MKLSSSLQKDETHGQEKLASEKGALTDPRMKELLGDDVYQALA